MADYRTDSAVIYCVVCVWIKKRKLKYPGGEDDLIHRWAVIGVYCGGCHSETAAVYWFAQLSDHFIITPLACVSQVLKVCCTADTETVVVFPFIRITNLGHKSM